MSIWRYDPFWKYISFWSSAFEFNHASWNLSGVVPSAYCPRRFDEVASMLGDVPERDFESQPGGQSGVWHNDWRFMQTSQGLVGAWNQVTSIWRSKAWHGYSMCATGFAEDVRELYLSGTDPHTSSRYHHDVLFCSTVVVDGAWNLMSPMSFSTRTLWAKKALVGIHLNVLWSGTRTWNIGSRKPWKTLMWFQWDSMPGVRPGRHRRRLYGLAWYIILPPVSYLSIVLAFWANNALSDSVQKRKVLVMSTRPKCHITQTLLHLDKKQWVSLHTLMTISKDTFVCSH